MIWNILENENNAGGGLPTWAFAVIFAVLIVLLVVWFFFSGRKNRQADKEYAEQLEALAPGHKVKTAGGICGIVVEVCDDNTVVIETGTEASGKSRLKIDKLSIVLTDAKGPTQIAREAAAAKKNEEKTENKAPMPAAMAQEPVSEEPAEELPAEQPEEAEQPAETDGESAQQD